MALLKILVGVLFLFSSTQSQAGVFFKNFFPTSLLITCAVFLGTLPERSFAQEDPRSQTPSDDFNELISQLPEETKEIVIRALHEGFNNSYLFDYLDTRSTEERDIVLNIMHDRVTQGSALEQSNALWVLEYFRDQRSVPILAQKLLNNDGHFNQVVMVLSGIQDHSAVVPLLQALHLDMPSFRRTKLTGALKNLASFVTFEEAYEHFPYALYEDVNDTTSLNGAQSQSYSTVEDAIEILHTINDPRADAWLVELLVKSRNSLKYTLTIISLMRQNPILMTALPVLQEKQAQNPDFADVAATVSILEMVEDPHSIDRFRNIFNAVDENLRWKLIHLIADLNTPESLLFLKEILDTESEPPTDEFGRYSPNLDPKAAACDALSKASNRAAFQTLADWAEVHFAEVPMKFIRIHDTLKRAFETNLSEYTDEERLEFIRICRSKLKYPGHEAAFEAIALRELSSHPMIQDLLREFQ